MYYILISEAHVCGPGVFARIYAHELEGIIYILLCLHIL